MDPVGIIIGGSVIFGWLLRDLWNLAKCPKVPSCKDHNARVVDELVGTSSR